MKDHIYPLRQTLVTLESAVQSGRKIAICPAIHYALCCGLLKFQGALTVQENGSHFVAKIIIIIAS